VFLFSTFADRQKSAWNHEVANRTGAYTNRDIKGHQKPPLSFDAEKASRHLGTYPAVAWADYNQLYRPRLLRVPDRFQFCVWPPLNPP